MEHIYQSCTLTDLARLAGTDLNTFQSWFEPADLKAMIDLGWSPFGRALKPPVVKYIRKKLIDKTLDTP